MKKWLLGTLAGASLLIAGCSQGEEVASTESGGIPQEEFHERLKNMPTQTGGTQGEQVLQQMIIEDVLEENYGDQVSDEEVDAALEEQSEAYGGMEQFESILSQSGMEMSTIEDSIRTNLYMTEAIKDHANFTEEDVREFHENQIPDGTRVAHILVEEEDQANDIIDELDDGADFAELAEEHSIDPGSASNGGEYELTSGQMVPEFEEAAMQLEEDEITEEPVETQNGFHVIQMIEKAERQEFEDVQEEVTDEYINTELATDFELVNQIIADLVQDANVQIADEDLQGAVAPFIETPEEEPQEEDSAEEDSAEEDSGDSSEENNDDSNDSSEGNDENSSDEDSNDSSDENNDSSEGNTDDNSEDSSNENSDEDSEE